MWHPLQGTVQEVLVHAQAAMQAQAQRVAAAERERDELAASLATAQGAVAKLAAQVVSAEAAAKQQTAKEGESLSELQATVAEKDVLITELRAALASRTTESEQQSAAMEAPAQYCAAWSVVDSGAHDSVARKETEQAGFEEDASAEAEVADAEDPQGAHHGPLAMPHDPHAPLPLSVDPMAAPPVNEPPGPQVAGAVCLHRRCATAVKRPREDEDEDEDEPAACVTCLVRDALHVYSQRPSDCVRVVEVKNSMRLVMDLLKLPEDAS
jgi:hypothetical protein